MLAKIVLVLLLELVLAAMRHFTCLTLTPWGLLTVLSDATQRFFFRWAQSLQEAHA